MKTLRFAAIGAGFWARYQLAAWREVEGAECAAVCDRHVARAQALARDLGITAAYGDPEELFRKERLDFVDIITTMESHGPLVRLAASRGVGAICQKPMAPTLEEAEGMVAACRKAGVPFFVHENWRWQTPLREVKKVLDSGRIGRPFRARITMVSGFPVFVNQPNLREDERFILLDMGTHLLDLARFYFGEAESVYCRTARVHPDIRGEDVATVVLAMHGGAPAVICEMGYPGSFLERECFPETLIFIEGEQGSLELAPDLWLRVTTAEGTHARRCPPPSYPWANPDYAIVHSSLVDCHRDLFRALAEDTLPETHGEDNLKTLRLVFAAYESAERGEARKPGQ